jgi:hypothetical protein
MNDPELHIAADLALPLDAVTETFLILGKRGSGKTNTAVVLTEEMIGAGLPVCVIDPTGVWWGLRSSADGQGPGLPVTILGGEHADLPLSPDSGSAVADLVVDERLPLVLDLKLMSKTKQRRFMTDFLERVYHRNRDPLHLVIDEADLFAPQRATAEIARLLGAYEDVVRRGRANGLGSTSITQRPSGMHTDIRSQPEALITLRLIGKHDIVAIDEWIKLHDPGDEAAELKASLPSLPTGTAWVWSPGWLELLARVQIRPRRTFDSSATPKVGQQRIVPRAFAPVDAADLERLAARLGNEEPAGTLAPDDAAAMEIGKLRTMTRELCRQLAEAQARPAERIEVPVLQPGDVAALEQAITGLRDVAASLELALSRAAAPHTPAPARIPPVRPVPKPPQATSAPPEGDLRLRAGARNMLTVLARQHPVRITRRQLAALAKLKVTGGTFGTYFGDLRRAGLIEQDGDFVTLTGAGFTYTGTSPDLPVTAEELRETWRGSLRAGARKMLDLLIERYPEAITRSELAAMADLKQSGGTFGTYLGDLRRNGLAEEAGDGIRAAEVFFLAGSAR